MPYATRQNLIDRYGLDEIEQRESALPVGAVDGALADAAAEIDSYCARRYAVPLSPAPANIVRVACAIARYHLLGEAATERARADYEDARAFLRDVQAGKALLDGAAALPAAAPAATVEIAVGRTKTFAGGIQ